MAADSISTEAEDVSSLVLELTPSAEDVSVDEILVPSETAAGDILIEDATGIATTLLPADGDGEIASAIGVNVGMPAEAVTADAEITDQGLVSYPAISEDDTSIAVLSTAQNTRIHTVIPGASSPTEYSYPVSGATPRLNEDGSVDLLGQTTVWTSEGEVESVEDVVASIAVPWARDANGDKVPTHFEIQNETIVQVVEIAADTAFPVVADPDIWWILGTAAACAVEIAGLTMVGAKVVSVFAKADKLIKSTKSIVSAYNALGGKFDKVMSLVKKYVKNKSSLTKKQVNALEKLIKAVGITVFGWLGLGSCYDLVTTKY
jgi:hypothetical protein